MASNNDRLQELAAAEGIRLMKCQCGSFQLALGGASFHLSPKSIKSLCEVLLTGLQGGRAEEVEYTQSLTQGDVGQSQSMH